MNPLEGRGVPEGFMPYRWFVIWDGKRFGFSSFDNGLVEAKMFALHHPGSLIGFGGFMDDVKPNTNEA